MVSRWLTRYERRFTVSVSEELQRKIEKLESLKESGDPKEIRKSANALIESAETHLPFYKRGVIREWIEPLVSAFVIAMFLKAFVVGSFKIPSGSMFPTLLVGDHILANRLGYGFMIPFTDIKVLPFLKVKRGDVVVFKWPRDPSLDFIKRVVGLPGDTIAVRDGNLYVNGEPCRLEKAEIFSGELDDKKYSICPPNYYIETLDGKRHLVSYSSCQISRDFGPIKIPEGHYFMMGDNRDNSNDSRFWGFVPFKYIKGKAFIIYWSWGPHQLKRIGKIVR